MIVGVVLVIIHGGGLGLKRFAAHLCKVRLLSFIGCGILTEKSERLLFMSAIAEPKQVETREALSQLEQLKKFNKVVADSIDSAAF